MKGYISNRHLPGWAFTKPMWGRKPAPSTIRSRTNYTQKRSSSSKAPQGQHVLAYSRVEAIRATASWKLRSHNQVSTQPSMQTPSGRHKDAECNIDDRWLPRSLGVTSPQGQCQWCDQTRHSYMHCWNARKSEASKQNYGWGTEGS